ncbi:DnaJ domain-containing protein [Streptomyces coeruleoprunus]|uniref:DnaJ domain-containing protein n=1 Tax=Streptomyces coeruleoprunus TaxID=285563 RepID=A0ABV9XA60_9ACTN
MTARSEPPADHRPDLYATLGVAPTASAEQITSAYRRLVRALHPDTRPAEGDQEAAAGRRLAR